MAPIVSEQSQAATFMCSKTVFLTEAEDNPPSPGQLHAAALGLGCGVPRFLRSNRAVRLTTMEPSDVRYCLTQLLKVKPGGEPTEEIVCQSLRLHCDIEKNEQDLFPDVCKKEAEASALDNCTISLQDMILPHMLSKYDTLEGAVAGGYSLVHSCQVHANIAQCTCFMDVLHGILGFHVYAAIGKVLHNLAKVLHALQSTSMNNPEGGAATS